MLPLGPEPGESIDVLGEDKLVLIQPREGYRFSIDSLLLWGFLRTGPDQRWIDLGTGCGILAIALAKISGVRDVTGLEVQSELVSLARRNACLNQVEVLTTFLMTDIRDAGEMKSLGFFDGVCANPPYYPVDSGRINPEPQKAVARHEIRGSMDDFIKAGSRLLKKGGRYVSIIPIQRFGNTLQILTDSDLNLSRMRFVHSYKNQPATLALLEASKGKKFTLSVEPPLIIYEAPKIYTREVQALMQFHSLRNF